MTTISIQLEDAKADLLREKAKQYGNSLDQLVADSLEDLLARLKLHHLEREIENSFVDPSSWQKDEDGNDRRTICGSKIEIWQHDENCFQANIIPFYSRDAVYSFEDTRTKDEAKVKAIEHLKTLCLLEVLLPDNKKPLYMHKEKND